MDFLNEARPKGEEGDGNAKREDDAMCVWFVLW